MTRRADERFTLDLDLDQAEALADVLAVTTDRGFIDLAEEIYTHGDEVRARREERAARAPRIVVILNRRMGAER